MRGVTKINDKFYWVSTAKDTHWMREITNDSFMNKIVAEIKPNDKISGKWLLNAKNIGRSVHDSVEEAKTAAMAELVFRRMSDGKPS